MVGSKVVPVQVCELEMSKRMHGGELHNRSLKGFKFIHNRIYNVGVRSPNTTMYKCFSDPFDVGAHMYFTQTDFVYRYSVPQAMHFFKTCSYSVNRQNSFICEELQSRVAVMHPSIEQALIQYCDALESNMAQNMEHIMRRWG